MSTYEFELKLSDGRKVYAVVLAAVTFGCDCRGESHNHITDLEIESAEQLFTVGSADGADLLDDVDVMAEIERRAERAVYRELEAA